jgi:hypothetical protein
MKTVWISWRNMSRLSRRVQKLEAKIGGQSGWNVSLAEVNRVALGKLSPADREIVQQAMARRDGGWLSESHPAVWDRWDVALGEAFRETEFPVILRAMDWGL